MNRWDASLAPLGESGPPAKACQFIHGDVPRRPDEPNFCGAPVLLGPDCLPISPYCEEHHEICHTKAPKPTHRHFWGHVFVPTPTIEPPRPMSTGQLKPMPGGQGMMG